MAKVSMANNENNSKEEIQAQEPAFDDVAAENEDLENTEDSSVGINVEDLDPDLQIWEDGPTAKDIVDWKKKYGDVYVTSVTFDKHVVWRTLNRNEYKMIVRQIEQVISSGKMTQTEANMLNEELVCQFCTLFPQFSGEDFSKELAGLPSILAQQILESSGFTTVDVRQL